MLKELVLFVIVIQRLLPSIAFSSSVPTEKPEPDTIIRNTSRIIKTVQSRKVSPSFRRRLPEDLFQEDFDPLECGASYSIAEEGHLYFNLSPGSISCHYDLLGSRNEGCTVAVYCNGTINLAPEGARGCEREFLVLTDGTEGLMSGCGEFSFHKTPRYARNGGKDLYIYVRGNEKNTLCVALCMEDLRPGMYGLNEPKKIAKNQKFTGLWVEGRCQCGIRGDMTRAEGGENATKNEFPWVVVLVFPGTRKPFCDGSLINDRYILSAGHCFGGDIGKNEVEVLLHVHVLDKSSLLGFENDPTLESIPGWDNSTIPTETDESEFSVRRRVVEIRVHPMFDIDTFNYDYAILKLEQPIDFVGPDLQRLSPICLPHTNEVIRFQDDETMVVAGWDMPWEDAPATTRFLQKLDLPFVNRRTCREYADPTERHICAGYLEGGEDACSGVSGGPLIYMFNPDNNQYLLCGVVSAGAGCARENQLGLYSDVQEAVQWIHFNTPGAVWCARE